MKNEPIAELQARLTEVEQELRRITAVLARDGASQAPWWRTIVGTHENDAIFDEMLRLGRAIRKGKHQVVVRKTRRKKATTRSVP